MNLEVDVDDRFWAQIPSRFPSDGFPDAVAWEDAIVARYEATRAGLATPAESEDARRVARHAREQLEPTAAFGLLFWPAPVPAAISVQVDLVPPGTGAGRMAATLLDGVPLAERPVISDVIVPGFGEGVSARFLASAGSRDEPAVAGIGYLVAGPSCVVRFMSQPATSTLIGLLQDPLDEVVRTIRVTT